MKTVHYSVSKTAHYLVGLVVCLSIGACGGQEQSLDELQSALAYCGSSGGSQSYEWISSVKITCRFYHASGASGYSDFTAQTVNLTKGSSASIELTPGFASGAFAEQWSVWIDFNQDGVFQDPDEQVFSAGSSSTAIGTFQVPTSVASGLTRLRVSMRYSNPPSPCGSFDFGEVEDYTANILDAPPVPPVADFSANKTSIAVGDSVVFSDQSVNQPTSWSWEFPGGTPATSTAQNPTVTYTAAGTYDVVLTATNAFGSHTARKIGFIQVAQMPSTYCDSRGEDSSHEWISAVEIGSFVNSSGAAGYTDFTNLTVELGVGSSHNVSLTPGFSGGSYMEHWRIWIDFNADADFVDPGEMVFEGSAEGITTGFLAIPASASGTTRMRISMRYNAPPAECGALDYGEVEDYTVVFTSVIFTKVTPAEAYSLIQQNAGNPNFVILDVRTPAEYAAQRIENAVNIDFYSPTFDSELDLLDKSKAYLIYCRTGNRSGQTQDKMQVLGFVEAYDLLGGITQWTAEGYPTVP